MHFHFSFFIIIEIMSFCSYVITKKRKSHPSRSSLFILNSSFLIFLHYSLSKRTDVFRRQINSNIVNWKFRFVFRLCFRHEPITFITCKNPLIHCNSQHIQRSNIFNAILITIRSHIPKVTTCETSCPKRAIDIQARSPSPSIGFSFLSRKNSRRIFSLA